MGKLGQIALILALSLFSFQVAEAAPKDEKQSRVACAAAVESPGFLRRLFSRKKQNAKPSTTPLDGTHPIRQEGISLFPTSVALQKTQLKRRYSLRVAGLSTPVEGVLIEKTKHGEIVLQNSSIAQPFAEVPRRLYVDVKNIEGELVPADIARSKSGKASRLKSKEKYFFLSQTDKKAVFEATFVGFDASNNFVIALEDCPEVVLDAHTIDPSRIGTERALPPALERHSSVSYDFELRDGSKHEEVYLYGFTPDEKVAVSQSPDPLKAEILFIDMKEVKKYGLSKALQSNEKESP